MRRVVTLCAVAVILIVAFLAYSQTGKGGCHGSCFGPPTPTKEGATPPATPEVPPTPTDQERCQAGFDTTFLGLAELEPEHNRPLCLIDIDLTSVGSTGSEVDPGETTVFYVRAGSVEFTLVSGSVRVVPASGDAAPAMEQLPDGSYAATSGGDPFTISAGGTIFLDQQTEQVVLNYAAAGEGEAALLIASAPPVIESAATPEA